MAPRAHETPVLLLEAAGSTYALNLADVSETLRPLRVETLPHLPGFVLGAARVRGVVAPVADLSCLLTGRRGLDRRWISLRCNGRPALLSVDRVRGVSALAHATAQALPPLLDDPATPVAQLRVLDSGLLAVLEAGRLIPDAAWEQIRQRQELVA